MQVTKGTSLMHEQWSGYEAMKAFSLILVNVHKGPGSWTATCMLGWMPPLGAEICVFGRMPPLGAGLCVLRWMPPLGAGTGSVNTNEDDNKN